MSDAEALDPEVERLVAILQKDEDERTDEDWDALGNADPAKLAAAGQSAGVDVE